MAEQRYQGVLAVVGDGETVTDVAARFGVARKTVHDWLRKYEVGGIENLGDRSHRPRSCPHQMPDAVEVAVAELRRAHPTWGPQRLVFELGRRRREPVPSESTVYRALVRLSLDAVACGDGPGSHRNGRTPACRWRQPARPTDKCVCVCYFDPAGNDCAGPGVNLACCTFVLATALVI